MAQEEFIIKDAKQTVEKQVKRKPSIAELTTIESPGKPVPALQLEEKPKKKTKRYSKKSTGLATISNPKKDSILIITEKPQAALKIAQALSDSKERKLTENNASYFELSHNGEKIIVASAVGHLLNLVASKGQKGYPIFKTEWLPSYEKKSSAFTKRYYLLLKKLSRKAKEIIIATDFDIEGEVIGWNVLRFICNKETAKRMKYSTLTKNELVDSYEKVLKEPNWGNAYAGETRHIVDWLYGINLSRALMSAIKTSGSFKILSIGRVQGPALKIIVDREKEISEFKPEPFWQVIAIAENTEFKHPKDIFDKSALAKFKGIKSALAKTTKKEEKIQPPTPFDLTSLQREAYRWHKISPSQTLRIAQQLYLDGLISYPRTSSQKIPDSIEPKKILKKLAQFFPKVKQATRPTPVEGKKSDPAHPSIYPTGDYKDLEEQELKLYNLIAKRFISCFSPDALTKNTRVTLETPEKLSFTASGLRVLQKGWTEIYPTDFKESTIPELEGKVDIDEIKFLDKETQPPKRFTPTSLITILEKKNLGTKATRSMIVDTLFQRGYLDGRSIKATPLGMKLIEALEKYSSIIIDENLTRQLEEEMEKITLSTSKFKEKEEKIVKQAEKIIEDISKEFKTKETLIGQELSQGLTEAREQERESNTIMPCPTCKKGNLVIKYSRKTRRQFVACSAYPDCTQTYTLPPDSLIKTSEKVCDECKFPKLLSLKKGKKPWEFCFNPNCPINKKRIEEYRAKKAEKEAEGKTEEKENPNN